MASLRRAHDMNASWTSARADPNEPGSIRHAYSERKAAWDGYLDGWLKRKLFKSHYSCIPLQQTVIGETYDSRNLVVVSARMSICRAPFTRNRSTPKIVLFWRDSMSIRIRRVVPRVAFAAVAVIVCCLFNAPARADQIVIISSSPTLELMEQPLSFSFEFDTTTEAVVGIPVISFNGATFTYNAGASSTTPPPTFVFEDGIHQIAVGDIGTFPQPGFGDFPAIGVYPGLLVGLDGGLSGFNGTVIVTEAAEPGLLALLGAGLLLLTVRPFRALPRGA